MTIFIAFKIDISISYSSKDIEMALGKVKNHIFKKYKFCNLFHLYVTEFVFLKNYIFLFPIVIFMSFELYEIVISILKAMNMNFLVV